MNEEEMMRRQQELEEAKLGQSQQDLSQGQERYYEQQDTSMTQEQLDLGKELERIENLLKGNVLKDGEWIEPKDKGLVMFSDYGVHLITNTMAWYMNKNTLLSNYDEATILEKMLDFTNDLNDTIFMEYEKVFQYPSTQECIDALENRITKKAEIKQYALKLVGIEKDIEVIKKEKIKEIEEVIERELEKIKEQFIKNKLKRFMMTMRVIQDAIHSTYLRALHGTERSSLRKHMSIVETKGISSGGMNPQNQQGGKFSQWFKRR